MTISLRRPRAALALAVALFAIAAVAAAGRGQAATVHEVDIADFAYSPATLTIQAGDTVRWTNRDTEVHTATSTAGGWDSGDLAQGESWSLTFTAPGTYDYLCTPHPWMTGRIVVTAAPDAPAPTAAPSGGSAGVLPDVAMRGASPSPLTFAGLAILGVAVALGAWRLSRRVD